MNPYNIINHPYLTEKTMMHVERNNSLEFVVRTNATKKQIKKATTRNKIMIITLDFFIFSNLTLHKVCLNLITLFLVIGMSLSTFFLSFNGEQM